MSLATWRATPYCHAHVAQLWSSLSKTRGVASLWRCAVCLSRAEGHPAVTDPRFPPTPSPPNKIGSEQKRPERIGRQNLSQKVPSKKGSLGVIFSLRSYRENAHSKSANFEGRHSWGHLLGRPLLFTSDKRIPTRARFARSRE